MQHQLGTKFSSQHRLQWRYPYGIIKAKVSDDQLENMRIRTVDGNSFPLKDIANLEYERNLVSINHLNGRREVTIEADEN